MNEMLTTTDMLDKLDDFIPDLLKFRDRIDSMILHIKMFKQTTGVGSDRTKINIIFNAVLNYYDLTKGELKGKSRKGEVVVARQFFCALARELTELSYQSIGDYVNRDHATVMHSTRVIDNSKDTADTLYDHYEVVKMNVLDALDAI